MKYDAAVIGAGMAGVISALKLSASGAKVVLFEKLPVPGGFATSFKRRGFLFESAIHCVDSLGENGEMRLFFEAHGIDQKVDFIKLKDFSRIIYPEHDFVADFSKDNFLQYLKSSFSAEEPGIRRLFEKFDSFYRQFDSYCVSRMPQWLKLAGGLFFYPMIAKVSLATADQLISAYIKDAKLKALIGEIWRYMGLAPSRLSAFYFLLVLRGFFYEPTCYVKGGFGRLFSAITDKIKENGGTVLFNTEVRSIKTAAGRRVRGLVASGGKEYEAPCVISNASAPDTLLRLLDNPKASGADRIKLSGLEKSVSAFQVYLGLRLPAKGMGMDHAMISVNTCYDHDLNYKYSVFGDYENCPFTMVDHAQIDPSLVEPGKGSLMVMALDNYSNWAGLAVQEYKKKKAAVAAKLISRAERYLPGLSGCIEVMEAATPLTMARYGSSPEGAIYGFAQTPDQAGISRLAQKTAVKGLFLTGAWTRPGGGVHGCFVSGIDAAEMAMKHLGRR